MIGHVVGLPFGPCMVVPYFVCGSSRRLFEYMGTNLSVTYMLIPSEAVSIAMSYSMLLALCKSARSVNNSERKSISAC